MGRKPDREEVARVWMHVRMTVSERRDLDTVARDNNVTVSAVLREAVNEYVSDYRDRAVFSSPRR
jgi:hypothetical protein